MPLAIDLIAHLVDCEGLSSVLNRWEAERTSLLSEGHDKGSNLDLSISLSLDSPRLTSVPHTRDLLSLLSILPDGISDIELSQSQIPIDNILTCRAALLQTSLAYRDDNKRLKVLVPIREYMAKTHPPMPHLIQPILKHFHKLLEVYTTSFGTSSAIGVGARIRSNLGNIQNILLNIHELNLQKPDLITAMYSTCDLAFYNRHSGLGGTPLMTRVSNVLPQLNDHRLEVYFIVEYITGHRYHHILNAEKLVAQALGHFTHFDDPDLKCEFYIE
jgi:hypothetical protein